MRVRQGSEVIVHVINEGDLEATVHWHGLRLDNAYDGVPHETQVPVPVGGDFTYRIRFPDPGLYWYHPHIREDYTQEMGLYGNILVIPAEPGYWLLAHRDVLLTLDDLLLEDGKIAPFSAVETTYAATPMFSLIRTQIRAYDLAVSESGWPEGMAGATCPSDGDGWRNQPLDTRAQVRTVRFM